MLAAIPALSVPPSIGASSSASAGLFHKRVVIIGGSIGGLATAACLRAAGFINIQVVEKAKEHRRGAGIALDDASIGILKGLGLTLGSTVAAIGGEDGDTHSDDGEERNTQENYSAPDIKVQMLRWAEERVVNNSNSATTASNNTKEKFTILEQQPYPYSGVLYCELTQRLETLVNTVDGQGQQGRTISRGTKAVKIAVGDNNEQKVDGSSSSVVRVHLEDTTTGKESIIECDFVVVADGPRSKFREQIVADHSHSNTNNDAKVQKEDDLRFAGYTAWRGTVPEVDLSDDIRSRLRKVYPLLSNCLYCLWGPAGKSAVLYDIGNGLVNWIVYECCDKPNAPCGRTTTTATTQDIALLKKNAISEWGDALGAVIECSPDPFQNDIYDIRAPLTSFINNTTPANICLVGDAAHPITPHCACGSNLALRDAYILSCAAQKANSITEMLQHYSQSRVADCSDNILMSRHLGRLRNGMSEVSSPRPMDTNTFRESLRAFCKGGDGIAHATLPMGTEFAPTWAFVETHVPESQRGFWLQRHRTSLHLPIPES